MAEPHDYVSKDRLFSRNDGGANEKATTTEQHQDLSEAAKRELIHSFEKNRKEIERLKNAVRDSGDDEQEDESAAAVWHPFR